METIKQGKRTEGAGDIERQVREGPRGRERVPARGAAGDRGVEVLKVLERLRGWRCHGAGGKRAQF